MTNRLSLALTSVVALVAMACSGSGAEEEQTPGGIAVVVASPTGPATPLPRRTPPPTPAPPAPTLQVCAPNPDPAAAKALQVQEPRPEQQVKVPFHVRGWGSNIADRGVALSIVNAEQKVIQTLDLPPQPRTYRLPPSDLERTEKARPFAADIVIPGIAAPTPFCLWVYQETNEAGRPKGVVQIPIVVVP